MEITNNLLIAFCARPMALIKNYYGILLWTKLLPDMLFRHHIHRREQEGRGLGFADIIIGAA